MCPGLGPAGACAGGLRPEPVEGGWEHRVLPGADVTREGGGGLEHLSQGRVEAWDSARLLQWCGPSDRVGCRRGARPGAGPSRRRGPRLPTFITSLVSISPLLYSRQAAH